MLCSLIKSEILGNYVIENDKIISINEFEIDKTKKQPGVYEVIRVIDGVPLFLEKHIERFKYSADLLGYSLKANSDYLIRSIHYLVKLNNCKNGNIKVVINSIDNAMQYNYFFFIKSSYPSLNQIMEGVPTILFSAERSNPNTKSLNLYFREKINEELLRTSSYEALLVDKNGYITEGSKSNVFLVRDKTLYTPPTYNVLPGITRGSIIEICQRLNVEVIEQNIHSNTLKDFDGLFITGTSPKVLPISSVDNIIFSSAKNSLIITIKDAYDMLINEYIQSRK